MSSEQTDPEADPADAAPTLSAVAKRAGVSSITVSRVVRMPDLVAPETRARVEQAMRELGYIPNLVAGALASARTNSVGVLVPTIANSIFADTVQGLSDKLEPLGFSVILAQSRYDAAREDRMLAALLSRRPEAIIMVGSPATEEGSRLLRNARIPIVETWDLPATPIDAVAGFDNYKAGVAVAKHLVAQGRKQLAFIGGDDPRATAPLARLQGRDPGERPCRTTPVDPRSQRLGQCRGACAPAWCRCRVRRQRRACDRLHGRLAQGGLATRGAGVGAAGCRHRSRRSRNGAADLACAEHDQRAWRRDRPHCGDADA
ncbi:LacI family transcriptional regulator [Bradyrhizobium sp. ISRA435]|nr:LacI family transcriptional regulator [Bradyrhizobium sp. ISRA435]